MSGPWLIVVNCSISLSMPDSEKLESNTIWSCIRIFAFLGVSQDTLEHFVLLPKIKSEEKNLMKVNGNRSLNASTKSI